RPVVMFDRTTASHATGWAAVPAGWKWTGLALGFSGAMFLWMAATRFGPPEPDARVLPPARMEHVEAVAATIDRQRPDPAMSTDRIRRREPDLAEPKTERDAIELGRIAAERATRRWARIDGDDQLGDRP